MGKWPTHQQPTHLPHTPMSLFDPPPGFSPPADSDSRGLPEDPYLNYRPVFARSLPIQILVTGITATLVTILLIQLIFSAPSHLRIARTNFVLQISAALSLLAWEIASLTLILNESAEQSSRWPFMLDYIAIDFPPLNNPTIRGRWSTGGLVSWTSLNALVSVLTQVCHFPFAMPTHRNLTFFKAYAHPISRSHVSFPH